MATRKRGPRPALQARAKATKKAKKLHGNAMLTAIVNEGATRQGALSVGKTKKAAAAEKRIRQIKRGAKGPRKLKR